MRRYFRKRTIKVMNDISINNDNLKSLGNELKILSNDYHEVIEKIKVQVNDIQESSIWNGADNIHFSEASDKYLTSFKNAKEVLQFYSDFLIQANAIYETLENDFSSRIDYE